MQTLDNSIRLRPRNRLFGGGMRLQSEPDPDNPSPTYLEAANDAAKRIAERLDGIAQSSITEALANIPATAHILGGAVIGKDPVSPRPGAVRVPGAAPARVLFLCTGNSARSQIAEALAGRLSGGAVSAQSAGSHPKPLHPNAVRVMRARRIDIAGRRSKHLSEFADQRFDYVISLCDRVREVCPEFPDWPELIHWSTPDPAREPGNDEQTLPAFERTATELGTRIGFLIAAIEQTTRQEVTERA
jgi:ArsR family transcriptional regulator, arsenate/arsenite/antimonite-responsive transcriptional repressor / arsenate reductase (thioredoxin)